MAATINSKQIDFCQFDKSNFSPISQIIFQVSYEHYRKNKPELIQLLIYVSFRMDKIYFKFEKPKTIHFTLKCKNQLDHQHELIEFEQITAILRNILPRQSYSKHFLETQLHGPL